MEGHFVSYEIRDLLSLEVDGVRVETRSCRRRSGTRRNRSEHRDRLLMFLFAIIFTASPLACLDDDDVEGVITINCRTLLLSLSVCGRNIPVSLVLSCRA